MNHRDQFNMIYFSVNANPSILLSFFFNFHRIAVVTGANKGIGFEISKQLASNGVFVVLTARDVTRGNEAIEKLTSIGISNVVFHPLDVVNGSSINSLAEFVKAQFGKLDILVKCIHRSLANVMLQID